MSIKPSNIAPFKPDSLIIKPYALMDLDDTLFQTQRKIEAWQLPTAEKETLLYASVNKQGEPLSLMTQRQQLFFNWLASSTELIVVTARDREEIKRVKLNFDSWQVLTHGAVILQPSSEPLQAWQQHIGEVLWPLQGKLNQLVTLIEAYNHNHQDQLKLALHHDNFLDPKPASGENQLRKMLIYLAIKHRQKDAIALEQFGKWLLGEHPDLSHDYYIHSNANNLAILPKGIHKRHAVAYLLEQCLDRVRPSFGFGDSLADLPFLQQLDWYGTPNHGQLHDHITSQ
ncbi:HAD hydrolase family protein [Psychrobacter sp.]|uniref:HAD hydrolase family protein n=1 Tax=Psychrobacter sp. TaxID=56811 RepID=UPI0025EDCD42|nr:HAD hydrolase family protein [Psychrobacter sp.]